MSSPDDKKTQKDQLDEARIEQVAQDLFEKMKQDQAEGLRKIQSQVDLIEKQAAETQRTVDSVQRGITALRDEHIFEGNVYGTNLSQLIKNAYGDIRSLRTANEIFNLGLDDAQKSMAPYHYDIIAGTYLLTKSGSEANSTNLDGHVVGKNKGEIGRAAKNLKDKGYLAEPHSEVPRKKAGGPKINFELTSLGEALLLGKAGSRLRTTTKDPQAHREMELARLWQAVHRPGPMEPYMSIKEIPGVRCDGIVRFRRDSENFSDEVIVVNIETEKDFLEDSSTERDKEGQVYLNMVTPFTFGVKCLEIVHPESKLETLMGLWSKLPKYLRERINFREV